MAQETGAAERAKARTIGPLRGLWPFVRPYRALLWGALAALTVTAGLSLSLPLAVRRVIDNFFAESLAARRRLLPRRPRHRGAPRRSAPRRATTSSPASASG